MRSENAKNRTLRGIGMLVYLSVGPILWALHLTVVYGTHTLVCARAISRTLPLGFDTAQFVILSATAVALVFMFSALLIPSRQTRPFQGPPSVPAFYPRVMALLVLLSAFGVVWAGVAALILRSCHS